MFANYTNPVGLMTKGDETHYMKAVVCLIMWCKNNNLLLNVSKTEEIVVNFQTGYTQYPPLAIEDAVVERVSSNKFLRVQISKESYCTTNTASLAKKVLLPVQTQTNKSPTIHHDHLLKLGLCLLQGIVSKARRIIGAALR